MNNKQPLILIADDDLDDRELLEEGLLQVNEKVRIQAVAAGKDVVVFLSSCEGTALPHLIVLDYNIPDMDGLDILRYVKSSEAYNSIPLVFWSTSDSFQSKQACESGGAVFFATKPMTVDGIETLAKRMLALCTGHGPE